MAMLPVCIAVCCSALFQEPLPLGFGSRVRVRVRPGAPSNSRVVVHVAVSTVSASQIIAPRSAWRVAHRRHHGPPGCRAHAGGEAMNIWKH